jgi:hypothetical protein
MIPKTYCLAAIKTRARASTYQLLYGGGGAPSLQDVTSLTSSAPTFPATTMAYIMQNKGYVTLLDGVLGVNHRVSGSFCTNFLPNLSHIILTVDEEFGSNVSAFLLLMLHHMQLAIGIFLQDALSMSANADEPDLNELINLVCRQQWSLLPPLPSLIWTTNHQHTQSHPMGPPLRRDAILREIMVVQSRIRNRSRCLTS